MFLNAINNKNARTIQHSIRIMFLMKMLTLIKQNTDAYTYKVNMTKLLIKRLRFKQCSVCLIHFVRNKLKR